MKAKVLSLKPTQFAVGMDEVAFRVKEMRKMYPKERHEYLLSHKIPVIRGPDGLYLIDKHHLVRACWEVGLEHVPVVIKADLRTEGERFWITMQKNNWVYLKDQFGYARSGRKIDTELPRNVRCLADNPWRSLAWRVRVKGGFNKSTEPFAEFQWAEFFRDQVNSWEDVHNAMKLCKLGKHLPGYKGPHK